MTAMTTAPTMPMVGSWTAWSAAWSTSVPVLSPTAVPAAAAIAVSSTAIPMAHSQPKKAAPALTPPNRSCAEGPSST
jgi:hypothetical protein